VLAEGYLENSIMILYRLLPQDIIPTIELIPLNKHMKLFFHGKTVFSILFQANAQQIRPQKLFVC